MKEERYKYPNIREEELKNRVAADFFERFDCTKIIGNVDFAVSASNSKGRIFNSEDLLWAEAKKGNRSNIYESFVQLILTIGKARTFDKNMPPAFLGAFDGEKIAFVSYNSIQDVFYQNDFNWKVAPSDHETKEFQQLYGQVKNIIEKGSLLFNFIKDERELREFIKKNFIVGKSETTKIKIDKNNFIIVYNKWLETVKPTIQVDSWDLAKKHGIIDGDFYLADLLSEENKTLKEKLFVLLKSDHYELDRKLDKTGFNIFKTTGFSDNQKVYNEFWNKYERPPKEDYWDYIIDR